MSNDAIQELRPGLHRWTAIHPEAEPSPTPGAPDDWGPDVASIADEAPETLLLVDPLVPEDRSDLRDELDALVSRHGQPVAIVTTLRFHRRSREREALPPLLDLPIEPVLKEGRETIAAALDG